MGVLIVEDRPDIHGIPQQLTDMPELVLAIQVKTGRIIYCGRETLRSCAL